MLWDVLKNLNIRYGEEQVTHICLLCNFSHKFHKVYCAGQAENWTKWFVGLDVNPMPLHSPDRA